MSPFFLPLTQAPLNGYPTGRGQKLYPISAAFIFMTREAAGELGLSVSFLTTHTHVRARLCHPFSLPSRHSCPVCGMDDDILPVMTMTALLSSYLERFKKQKKKNILHLNILLAGSRYARRIKCCFMGSSEVHVSSRGVVRSGHCRPLHAICRTAGRVRVQRGVCILHKYLCHSIVAQSHRLIAKIREIRALTVCQSSREEVRRTGQAESDHPARPHTLRNLIQTGQ